MVNDKDSGVKLVSFELVLALDLMGLAQVYYNTLGQWKVGVDSPTHDSKIMHPIPEIELPESCIWFRILHSVLQLQSILKPTHDNLEDESGVKHVRSLNQKQKSECVILLQSHVCLLSPPQTFQSCEYCLLLQSSVCPSPLMRVLIRSSQLQRPFSLTFDPKLCLGEN